MSLAFSLWFVVLSTILVTSKLWKIVILADLGALALGISLVPVTVADAKNRALGSEATNRLVEFLKADRGLSPLEATVIRIYIEPQPSHRRSSAIVVAFQEVTCQTYSVAAYQDQQALRSVLRSDGVNLVSTKTLSDDARRRLTTLCAQNRAQQKCGVLGVRDAISDIGAACFYQPRRLPKVGLPALQSNHIIVK
jgi:hypothetical protein